MNIFEEFIFVYFISAAALAAFAVLWRNWLEDHPHWKDWLHGYLGVIAKALTCGSCFTFWITLIFVLIFNPIGMFFSLVAPFSGLRFGTSYLFQWMALGWGALFLRFLYVAIQEATGIMVHNFSDHNHGKDH